MKRVLPVIVLSQFFCTSVWFAGNAIIADIVREFNVPPSYLAHVTSAVQFGFIAGTLVFAILAIADRISPSLVFLVSAILAASFNLVVSIDGISIGQLLGLRFATGFFLAGIYPVGMKIAADHYDKSLGKSLGFLLGALVLGTSFPHLLKGVTTSLPWKYIIYATSLLCLSGGLAMYLLVPDGPYRKQGAKPNFTAFLSGFRNKDFRAAAFGYFGHMWELYTFWAFLPVMATAYLLRYPSMQLNISVLCFAIIGIGCLACITSGLLSLRYGAKRIATMALALSGACCLVSPLVLLYAPVWMFIAFLLVWGMAIVADSPLFSTLVAGNAPAASKGSSLTIVNCIGFSITIVSIQFLNAIISPSNQYYIYMVLAMGPMLGLIALMRKKIERQ